MTWRIFDYGSGLPDLFIEADSSDEALEQARRLDDRYCSGQIYRKDNEYDRN